MAWAGLVFRDLCPIVLAQALILVLPILPLLSLPLLLITAEAELSVGSYGVLGSAGCCPRRNDMGSMMGDFR